MSFKSLLLTIACLLTSATWAQATVTTTTVGTGTATTSYFPYCYLEANSTTQMIYTATELGKKKGGITAIAFRAAKASAVDASVVVYMGHRSSATFASSTDYAKPATLTKVYDGKLTLCKATGWETITLNTPFAYNGTDNLVVVVGRSNGSWDWNKSLTYYYTATANTALYRYNAGVNFWDPTNTNYSYTTPSNYRPNIRVTIDTDIATATVGGISYILDSGKSTASVCGAVGDVPATLTIPSTIIVSGKAYSVTAIRDHAFAQATALTSLTLPATLRSIGSHAFYRCTALATITLSTGVTEIGDFAFAYTLPTEVVLPDALTQLGRGAFYGCTALTTINLPSVLTRLGSFAFKNCKVLQSIAIPAGIDSIEMHTFNGCAKMTEVQLPEGLQRIGDCAFQGCQQLASCTVPSSVTYIGMLAFDSCRRLSSLYIPTGLTHLGRGAFQYTDIRTVTIPSCIAEIPDCLFRNCLSLKSVTIQEGVTSIGREAFSNCALATVQWPTTLRKIGYQAFRGSRQTMEPVIPRGVTTFEPDLFFEHSKTKTIHCYADMVVPTAVFGGLDLYNWTLYVQPELLSAYRQSDLSQLFGKILPLGDTHVDGLYDITDVTTYISQVNNQKIIPYKNARALLQDLDGDGLCDQGDLSILGTHITQARQIPTYTHTFSAAPAFPATAAETGSTVLYDLDSYDHNTAMGLDIINQMRWEACIEGIRNPENTQKVLSESDYVPMRWSTDIERCTRIRAAECSYTRTHVRLNKRDRNTITSNGVYEGGECLGWSATVQGSLAQYYDEKINWVEKNGKVVGHYTNIITPKLHYVGVASTNKCAALGASSTDLSAKEHQFLDVKAFDYIPLQVATDYIADQCVMARCRPDYTEEAFSLAINTRTRVALFSHFENTSDKINGNLMTPKGVTYKTSDTSIATVDAQGFVYARKVGTADIIGLLNGVAKDTITVTVTCSHDYIYGEASEGKIPATCAFCGATKEVSCPHYYVYDDPVGAKMTGTCSVCGNTKVISFPTTYTIYWNNSLSGSTRYFYNPVESNPVGSNIMPWLYTSNGSSGYNTFLVECSNPELLDTSSELTYKSNWLVKGTGTVTVRIYSKYNPSCGETFTFNLTPAVTE